MWLRLRWQNLSSELLLFKQSVNLKTFVVVIFVLALKCSSCYNLSSQPELYLPFWTLIQHLHIKGICILKISSPNFHVIIYCIYMKKIEQIRKIPCLSLHVIHSLYILNTWKMYIWCFNTWTWISHAISYKLFQWLGLQARPLVSSFRLFLCMCQVNIYCWQTVQPFEYVKPV